MTLCVAYIRQVNETEELVFATDSCLTGGEKWKHGIKLFRIPKRDCLLCFAGSTARAYPLVLNLVSSIHLDKYLQSPEASLQDVLEYLSGLFTDLITKIISEIPGEDIHELRSGVQFLFGGWDWSAGASGAFRGWKLYYSQDVEGFIFDELTNNGKKRFYTFLGDPEEIEGVAKEMYKKMLFDNDIQDDPIDMEPLMILRDISLEEEHRAIDGSLQIGKVYKSNKSEFFSLMHPSVISLPIESGSWVPWIPIPFHGVFNRMNQGPYAPLIIPFPSLKSCAQPVESCICDTSKLPSGVLLSPERSFCPIFLPTATKYFFIVSSPFITYRVYSLLTIFSHSRSFLTKLQAASFSGAALRVLLPYEKTRKMEIENM